MLILLSKCKAATSRARLATLAILFGCAVLVPWAMAQEKCPKFFQALGSGSLEERYKKLLALTPNAGPSGAENIQALQRLNFGVYKLLQEAFLPLVNKVVREAEGLSAEKITALYKNLEANSPVQSQPFAYREKRIILSSPAKTLAVPYPEIKVIYSIDKSLGKTVERTVGDVAYSNIEKAAVRNGFTEDDRISAAKEFLWVKGSAGSELGNLNRMFRTVVTPVGEYGPDFSKKLLRTTEIMLQLTRDDPEVRKISSELAANSFQLLQQQTSRGRQAYSEGVADSMVPIGSAYEGVLSLHQLFTALLAKKMPGSESGADLLKEVIFSAGNGSQGILSETTSRLPMGTIGPLVLSGHGFAHGLARDAKGNLVTSSSLKNTLLDFAKRSRDPKSRCPMAGLFSDGNKEEKTGIQKMAEAYWKIFSVVDSL